MITSYTRMQELYLTLSIIDLSEGNESPVNVHSPGTLSFMLISRNLPFVFVNPDKQHNVKIFEQEVFGRKHYAVPPEVLWHGTGEKYVESIDREGLVPKSRLYVHLSGDIETAKAVGARHGKPVIYKALSGKMHEDGVVFYRSVNGVWLTKRVETKYLEKC